MKNNTLIDIELIKQYVDITEEELMMRLVKDAVGLQKEAEENKHRKEVEDRIADPEYRKYVLMFWNEYKYMSQYFSDDEIVRAAAMHMNKHWLTQEMKVIGHRPEDELVYCNSIFKRHGYADFTEYHGNWERKVRKPATFYTVASYYQLGSSDVSKQLLMDRFPYLKECFKVDVYYNFDHNDWIYIGFPRKGDNGKVIPHSLYTPISALMAKDAQAIIDCHLDYWNDYSHEKYNVREKIFIESEDVQAFLKKVAE